MEDTLALLRRAREGDTAARDRAVEANLRLVHSIVARFAASGHDPEDLFQIGCVGLVKAVDRFDLSLGLQFSTYAVPMIIGEIRRYLRDTGPLKVSRSLKQLAIQAKKKREELTCELSREPTVPEIAQALGVSREDLVEAMEGLLQPSSFFEVTHEGDGDPIFLIDQIAAAGDEESDQIDRLALREVLRKMDPRDRQIILLRYFREKTQAQVAEFLGVSQVQISRLERRALQNMRNLLPA